MSDPSRRASRAEYFSARHLQVPIQNLHQQAVHVVPISSSTGSTSSTMTDRTHGDVDHSNVDNGRTPSPIRLYTIILLLAESAETLSLSLRAYGFTNNIFSKLVTTVQYSRRLVRLIMRHCVFISPTSTLSLFVGFSGPTVRSDAILDTSFRFRISAPSTSDPYTLAQIPVAGVLSGL